MANAARVKNNEGLRERERKKKERKRAYVCEREKEKGWSKKTSKRER